MNPPARSEPLLKSTAAGRLLSARITSPAFGVPASGVASSARSGSPKSRYGVANTRSTAGAWGARCRIDGTIARISLRNGRLVTLAWSISPSNTRCPTSTEVSPALTGRATARVCPRPRI